METKVIHVPNKKLTDKQVETLCSQIAELYTNGYWIEKVVGMDEAGTMIVLTRE